MEGNIAWNLYMKWIWQNKETEAGNKLCFYAQVDILWENYAFLRSPNGIIEQAVIYPTEELELIEGLWHRFEVSQKNDKYYLQAISCSADKNFLIKYFQVEQLLNN